MSRKINWFGLAAGITILIVVVISLYIPWWQLSIGSNLITIYASPINTHFGLFGASFTVPIIWAINLIGILTFTVSGIIMLLYSVIPTKPYAKELIGFSYKKPIYALIIFIVGLVVIVVSARFLGLTVPLMGTAPLSMPSRLQNLLPGGISISGSMSASFQIPFYLGIVAGVLCVAARIYHGRINKTPQAAPAAPSSPMATPAVSQSA